MPEVVLTDGTKVEFGARTKVLKQSFIDAETGELVVKFAFLNGEVRETRLAPDHQLIKQAALHGLDQKFGDANAGLDDVEDCVAAFEDMADRIARGEWNERKGGDGMAGVSVLAKAMVEVLGVTKEQVKAMLADLSQAEKQALRKTKPIASVVQRIEAEKTKKAGVDGSALLAALQAKAAPTEA
jgi:hypothetical protein